MLNKQRVQVRQFPDVLLIFAILLFNSEYFVLNTEKSICYVRIKMGPSSLPDDSQGCLHRERFFIRSFGCQRVKYISKYHNTAGNGYLCPFFTNDFCPLSGSANNLQWQITPKLKSIRKKINMFVIC